jgi:hypothetical protein
VAAAGQAATQCVRGGVCEGRSEGSVGRGSERVGGCNKTYLGLRGLLYSCVNAAGCSTSLPVYVRL